MIKKFIKTHEHAWVLVYFVFYMPWYFGLQQRDISHFFDIYVGLDHIIPFVPAFIIPYIYWFLFVAGTLLFLFFYDADEFYRGFSFLACGMTISLIIFTIFPTTFCHRPEVLTGNAFEQFWLRFIYGADKPTNVFPSIHVFNSIGCAIALIKSKKFKDNKPMHIFAIISAVLITLSTMFIKQHSCMDAVAASIIAYVLYQLIYKREHPRLRQFVYSKFPNKG